MNPALDFISEAVGQEKPFLAIIWFHSPHKPVVYDPDHGSQYGDQAGSAYYSSISAIDPRWDVCVLTLSNLGLPNMPLLAYTSDNGPEQGEAGITGGLRARKRSLYEGGVRVPGIFVWPDRIAPEQVTTFPAVTSDYLPTVLDMLGLWNSGTDHERPLDGISLLPVFDGIMTDRPSPIGFLTNRNTRALIDNHYKIVLKGGKK